MSEEENKVLEYFKNNQVFDIEVAFNYIPILLNIIEGLQTKVDTGIEIIRELKEIEKSHKEENGKLRVEFEKVYEDNLTLAHELEQEKEKNKENIEALEEWINGERISIHCISEDKIKEKLELLKDILKAKEKDRNIYKQIPIEYLKGAIEQLEELLEEK